MLDATLCDKVFQWLVTGRWFSRGTLGSFTNKTDHHVITEILLKVALSTINQPIKLYHSFSFFRTIERSNFKTIVHISAITQSESSNIHLVAVTKTGMLKLIFVLPAAKIIKCWDIVIAFPLLSSQLYDKVTFFLFYYRKFHMNWTSFKRSPVLKKDTFSLSQRWHLNTGMTICLFLFCFRCSFVFYNKSIW